MTASTRTGAGTPRGDPSATAAENAVEYRSQTTTARSRWWSRAAPRRSPSASSNPLGLLVATGDALLDGLALSGLDAAIPRPGTYRLEVFRLDAAEPLEISVARTYEVP